MKDTFVIRVYEVVGSGFCVASDDGQKVYDLAASALKKGKKVDLSFLNVESLTSAFLNAAIGQLYGEFTDKKIKSNLTVSNMEEDDKFLLKRVVETAKQYFKNPDVISKARQEVLDGDGK